MVLGLKTWQVPDVLVMMLSHGHMPKAENRYLYVLDGLLETELVIQ
jgi:hypothetical protein